jgi:hypothetical protein
MGIDMTGENLPVLRNRQFDEIGNFAAGVIGALGLQLLDFGINSRQMLGAGIAPGNIIDEGSYFFRCPPIAWGFQPAGVDHFSERCECMMDRADLIGHILLSYAENAPTADR